MNIARLSICFNRLIASSFLALWMSPNAAAQIVPDASLPNRSIAPSGCVTCEITGGTRVGNNLFHSFEQFSVPTGGSAYFNNADSIRIIFSRVTGRSISNIDGLLRANGTADLFLINPNGIIFGRNASLNLGGSFVATTADRIIFEDGIEFSATQPQASPLLTVSTPIGLQFGQAPGAIRNASQFSVIDSEGELISPGLQVASGRTLALVGGRISLPGGILTAPDGQIQLGSVANRNLVTLSPIATGFDFEYPDFNFADIRLSQSAILNTTGESGGTIQLQGQNIYLSEGAIAASGTLGSGAGGTLAVNASESVQLSGISRLLTYTLGSGRGGDLTIETPRLVVAGGSIVSTATLGAGRAGNLQVNADNGVELLGTGTDSSGEYASLISSQVNRLNRLDTTGRGGDVTIETGRLLMRDGGGIDVSTFGAGRAGDLFIRAATIEAVGTNQNNRIDSGIRTQVEEGASGNAGRSIIRTQRLVILDGGFVAAATYGSGDAGNLSIHASEEIRLNGTLSPDVRERSRIVASSEPEATGNAGRLLITTGQLRVENGGRISVSDRTTGDPSTNAEGNLVIRAPFIWLDRGELLAETSQRNGGNLRLSDVDWLQMQNQSRISARALNNADGGNVAIEATDGFMVAAANQNNDIIANAVGGTGGNIQLAVQGILGLTERRASGLLPDDNGTNDIDASSEFGAPGSVTITNPDADPSRGLVELPADPIDAAQQIAQSCSTGDAIAHSQSEFVITGRGGLPPSPIDLRSSEASLSAWASLEQSALEPSASEQPASEQPASESPAPEAIAGQATFESPASIVEAQGWVRSADGRVMLVAATSERAIAPTDCQ